ncbi:hypothetical protein LCGC14_0828990 [marine sediment metagenome]|uniref:Uncharacterized protein n=1 Tax=marine sediment metagenome TaxID=412755 RepID=A0A0F9S1E2_9ZZZZ
MKIAWDLFNARGKWKYGGISEIPDETQLWDDNVLELIDKNQTEVFLGTITGRSLHLVVDLVEGSCKDDKKFFKAIFIQE